MSVANTNILRNVVNVATMSSEAVSPIFTELDIQDGARTSGRFIVTSLDALGLIRAVSRGDSFRVLRGEKHICSSAAQSYFVCLVARGRVDIHQAGRTTSIERGDIGIIDSASEYCLDITGTMDTIWLRIPQPMLQSRLISLEDLRGIKLNSRKGLGYLTAHMLTSVTPAAADLPVDRAPMLSHTLVDLLGAVIDDRATSHLGTPSKNSRLTLIRARKYIEDHLHEETLSLADIAEGVGVSRRYLSELFAAGGCSVMRWVLERRLQRCKVDLERNGYKARTISEIAYAQGFINISSFNRAFKSRFGQPPRAFIASRQLR